MPDLYFTADPVTEFSAVAVISSRNIAVTANPVTAFSASTGLSGRLIAVSVSPATTFAASAVLSSRSLAVAGGPVTSFTATVNLSSKSASLDARPIVSFLTSLNLTGASDSHGLSVCNVIREILMLWGISCPKTAPSFAIERAMNDLNSAMQTVWNQARERNYWSGSALVFDILHDSDSNDLPDNVQNVTGPCRLTVTKRPLALLTTLGELETFEDVYLDGSTSDEPLAYHIERLAQVGNDPAKCIFRCSPAPLATTSITLDVVLEAPRYTTDDLASCPIIPIPHRYVESLLIPIALYKASGFGMLPVSKESKESVTIAYNEAMAAMGLADPNPVKPGPDEKKP